ncbi:glycosyltransferase [Rhodoplanes sp. Z2-YC6860]|uniref:glycosyltransferase n=1 Tax=Rhodoplanes sp. Z2-YC6860 TaxID=674703 RepID=UPI00078D2D00|nr:glycosyltransferase [Rhodoplanes sp. Z2-YC6860]AMN41839.1 glycosyl transferase [Rhodoplanes sp. Z2-YC6860]
MENKNEVYHRLVVDITDWNAFLAGGSAISGIQRVTLNLLRSLAKQGLPFKIIRYDEKTRAHRLVETEFLSQDFSQRRQPSVRGKFPVPSPYAHGMYRHVTSTMRRRASELFKRQYDNPLDCLGPTYRPCDGDVLYLAGAGWDCYPTLNAAESLRRAARIRVVSEIFDLIPLFPDIYHDRRGARQFRRWLRHAVMISDSFICLSKHTRDDFLRNGGKFGLAQDTHAAVVTPAHEFSSDPPFSAQSGEIPRPQRSYVLCVAHVFNHKNARRLIEAWLGLSLIYPLEADLVLAGATPRSEILARYGSVPRLQIIERPSDTFLANLYKNAAFTVFPSLYEGWGMPVGESLWFGTPCLASSAASIPEAGGTMVDYFDPRASGELETLLARALFEPDFVNARRSGIDRTRLKTWDDYAGDIFAAATSAHPSIERSQPSYGRAGDA